MLRPYKNLNKGPFIIVGGPASRAGRLVVQIVLFSIL